MIKGQRLYNLLMCGALSASELDSLLERRDYLGALYALRGNEFRMADIGNNPLALEAFCRSQRAVRSLAAAENYLDYFLSSGTAYAGMAFSDMALQEEKIRARVGLYVANNAWKAMPRSVATARFNDVCRVSELGLYIGVGPSTTGVSTDLTDWSTSSLTGNFLCVCWSPEKPLAVAGGSYIGKSTDCRAWSSQYNGQQFNRLYWARRHMLFIGVASSNISTSGDADDWTSRASSTGSMVVDDGSQYISVRLNSSTQYGIMTSGDARTWASSNANVTKAVTLNDGCWIPERNRLVFVGDGGVLVRDGTTWSSRDLPSGVSLRSVAYSPRFKMLAAVGLNAAYASLDFGDTWIPSSVPARTTPNYDLNALMWDDAGRRFVANDKNSAEYVVSHPWELAA